MLRLACDMELVTKQLFAPLVTQMIHWFTTNREAENKETMALLDAIMDAAASPTDGALRQFAAECVSEYLQWSLKQQMDDNNPINMRSMMRRIYSLAHHPLPYKRLGAALTINQVCSSHFSLTLLTEFYD
jgi:DNA-dependent protein kinase catalytic subunit